MAAEEEAAAGAAPGEEPISPALAMDPLRLELGYGLLPLIGEAGGPRLTDQIKALRRQLAGELGFVMPPVRIQDNIQLPANTYVVKLKEIETGRGELRPSQLLVMDPKGDRIRLPGEETTEPTFGLPAKWIADSLREEASFRGLTVVDPATVLTTHLTEIIKDNLARAADLRRDPEAARRARQGLPEADRRSGAGPDQHRRHPARAAGAARRADLDPRSGADRRGDRRGGRRQPEHAS